MPLGECRPVMAAKINAGSIAAGLVAPVRSQGETRAPCANISFVTVAVGNLGSCFALAIWTGPPQPPAPLAPRLKAPFAGLLLLDRRRRGEIRGVSLETCAGRRRQIGRTPARRPPHPSLLGAAVVAAAAPPVFVPSGQEASEYAAAVLPAFRNSEEVPSQSLAWHRAIRFGGRVWHLTCPTTNCPAVCQIT
jgi:hypothetical protein